MLRPKPLSEPDIILAELRLREQPAGKDPEKKPSCPLGSKAAPRQQKRTESEGKSPLCN